MIIHRKNKILISTHTKDQYNYQRLAKALAETFVIPIHNCVLGNYMRTDDTNAIKILPLIDQGLKTISSRPFFGQQINRNLNNQSRKGISISTMGSFMNHKGQSPFPALDKFVSAKLANFKGINGSIRSWSMEDAYSSPISTAGSAAKITYQIKDNRWCEYIGRSHKSNGVMWNVSLYDMTYWQTCWDPDCRRRFGPCSMVYNNLPDRVVNEIRDVILENDIEVNASFERALMALDINDIKGNECGRSEADLEKEINVGESFEKALLNLTIENKCDEAAPKNNMKQIRNFDINSDEFEVNESFERALMNLNLNQNTIT